MHRMSAMCNYLRTHVKHHRSGGWSAANSSVIAKNSALMLSEHSEHGLILTWGFSRRSFTGLWLGSGLGLGVPVIKGM